ncbi:TonB-dependent siderophore receptor [Acetobacter syzygii]|uniref:TonB-dependent siderophore receptor n=1 Tax=Acetobacter syzygii TaxID=146476 RepID=UPI0015706552|nr:TonB-dependent siderophore receptor [Acetobacter syzygii]NSL91570.1 TonB-dependent siderophore receptor [Acetobacter syzygii]
MGAKSGDARMRKYIANSKVFLLTSALGGIVVSPLHAQTTTAKEFHISAQSLPAALTQFGRQAGLQVSIPASLVEGKTSHAVNGTMSPSQSLAQILSGTGLTYRVNGNVVTLVPASANITLGPVRVGGSFNAHQAAIGPGNGYVATYTDAGTKTDTPLWEIPSSVYVITKQEIQDQQAQNIQEALRYMPGVYSEQTGTENNGNAGISGSFKQRGFNSTQYIDGIQSNSRSAGETAFVERVEALNGPASVMYGQTSPGGIIATRLKQPTNTPIRNVSVGFGNWGRYEATFDVSDKVTKSGNVKYRIAGIGVTQGTQTDYIKYKRVGVLPSIKWDIDNKTSLTLLGSYMYTPDNGMYATGYPLVGTLVKGIGGYLPRSRFLGEPSNQIMTSKEARFEYQFSHKFNKYLEFQQTFMYENSSAYYNTITGGNLSTDGSTYSRTANMAWQPSRTIGLDSKIISHISTGLVSHTLVAGMDFRQVKVEQNIYYDFSGTSINIWQPQYGWSPNYSLSGPDFVINQDLNETLSQKGIYFQDQMKFHKLTVTLGGRQDWYSESDPGVYYQDTYTPGSRGAPGKELHSAFTWRAGFTYNFDFGLTPYFSYATSFMPQFGYFDASGKLFKPNQGDQFEAELKYLIPHSDIFLTAAAYHIKEDHYAITDTVNSGYQTDAGTVVSKGVELSAHANITKDLHLTASYSFNDTRVTKSDTVEVQRDFYGNSIGEVSEKGKYISGLPRNMVNMFVDYTPPTRLFHGLGVNFGIRYIGYTYADNANSFKAPAYTLFDVGAHYDFFALTPTLKGLKAQLAISNLTNKRYVTSCTGGGGACYYGQGQRIYGNLSYSW